MLHCTIDLSEDCNYSNCLQLQAGASCCRTTSCLNTMCKSCILSEINFPFVHQTVSPPRSTWSSLFSILSANWPHVQAPLGQNWPPATSVCSSPRTQETHGDRWGNFVFGLLWCLAGKQILHMCHIWGKSIQALSLHMATADRHLTVGTKHAVNLCSLLLTENITFFSSWSRVTRLLNRTSPLTL